MNEISLTQQQLNDIKTFQKNELTEYYIYSRLARKVKNKKTQKYCNELVMMKCVITCFGRSILMQT